MSKVQAVPAGLSTITASLNVDGASDAIAFYVKAFGAEEEMRFPDPSGKKIWHASLRLGTSKFFVSDVFPEMGATAHVSKLWLYTETVDALFARATAAGAKVRMPVTDMFWGDRMGVVTDPWNNEWTLAQHTKDMTPEEMMTAQKAFVAGMKK
jgi:uncharacterized glyoxalase superfamily protein PhnB